HEISVPRRGSECVEIAERRRGSAKAQPLETPQGPWIVSRRGGQVDHRAFSVTRGRPIAVRVRAARRERPTLQGPHAGEEQVGVTPRSATVSGARPGAG